MVPEAPFDSGLPAERTLLAWRRTVLSLAAASAVALRLVAQDVGALAVVVGGVGVLLCFAAYIGTSGRYRRAHSSLVEQGNLRAGGATVAVVSVACVAIAGFALVWMVLR